MNLHATKKWLTGLVTAIFVAVIFPAMPQAGSKARVEHVVTITGFKFVPDQLTVSVGDTIIWKNNDIAPHTATAKNKSWDTGKIKKGEQKAMLVTKDFFTAYFCRYHPVMKAKLTITPAQ